MMKKRGAKDSGFPPTKKFVFLRRVRHTPCNRQSASAIRVTQSVTEGVTHFFASHLVLPCTGRPFSKESIDYVLPSTQKRLFCLVEGFAICPLVRGVLADHFEKMPT